MREDDYVTGRPTKYKEEFCKEAIELMETGQSITQLARHFRVSKSTLYLWAQVHKEFSDALSLGREWGEAFWEGEIQQMMYSRDANAPLVKLYMTNRFGWTDKTQTDITSSDGSMKQPTRIELVAVSNDSKKD